HAVEFIVGMGEGPTRQDQDLTARAKKVIAYAVDEAKRLNHHYIGTEHLLLGLVRNGEGVATGVLDIMGVSLEQVRTQVMRVLRQGTSGSGVERPGPSAPSQRQSKTPYIGAGGAEGTLDAANTLNPALSRGEFQTIGATTLDEYRKYIERDAALERRFQPVMVDQPTEEETIEILRGIKSRYEDFHQLQIADDAIKAAAHLSARYVPDRFLPD